MAEKTASLTTEQPPSALWLPDTASRRPPKNSERATNHGAEGIEALRRVVWDAHLHRRAGKETRWAWLPHRPTEFIEIDFAIVVSVNLVSEERHKLIACDGSISVLVMSFEKSFQSSSGASTKSILSRKPIFEQRIIMGLSIIRSRRQR